MVTATAKYPAHEHARRVVRIYEELTGTKPNFAIYVSAEKMRLFPYCDQTVQFRQNRYFNYLSGAWNVPDAHVVYNTQNDKLVLYLPPVDEDDIMWSGLPLQPKEAAAKYDVDDVKIADQLEADLKALNLPVHAIEPSKDGFVFIKTDSELKNALDEARVIKDEFEVELLREANRKTDICHLSVMSALPIEKNEAHIHAEFTYHAIRQGSKILAYDPICCAGPHAGTLHYTRNDSTLDGKLNVLIDAGVEHEAYAADVTRVFPISGHWTKEGREIYDLVLKMNYETMSRIRPGIQWEDLHLLAHRILIDRFRELGIFYDKYTAEEIYKTNISAAFYPHGLGHMLGMDTHDTAGNANYEDPDVKLRYLRIRRKLQAGMVVTVEPGCYFNDFLIEGMGKDAKHLINFDVLKRYKPVGGVRIEDDVLVTPTGYENLTRVTKDPEEIAKIVQDGIARGRSHFHCLA